ncbi:diaminopimelate epimerase [Robiginitalea sediminis]|uniref:diaminopimelate epimerase n=1 Tax=Robiginitalea sediminis TaxID=1982593 RepID=UPI000B4B23EB|nr:diaminopimelate epimerase [Robiginitalea sediminis]
MEFYKYQATGNDFILVDDREEVFPSTDEAFIRKLCHRRFGIGADGLILIRKTPESDFRMLYFNSDGRPGSMCGNGGRCAVSFASLLGLIQSECGFEAPDGYHEAVLEKGVVSLKMGAVSGVHQKPRYSFVDTGSPHHVQLVDNLDGLDVVREGRRLRYSLYGEAGSNINFVRPDGPARFKVRTYERGVEDETYSCGTGVTAVTLAMHSLGKLTGHHAEIDTAGGTLTVRFEPGETGGYDDIWLTGPATMVFKGKYHD